MRKLLLAGLLLLLVTPVLSDEGNSSDAVPTLANDSSEQPVLISARENETEVKNVTKIEDFNDSSDFSERIRESITNVSVTHLRFNDTEVSVDNQELIVNASKEDRQFSISENELNVEGSRLLNASPIKVEIKTTFKTNGNETEVSIIRENNKVHIENNGVSTEVSLELNDHISVEGNQLILNKSGVERVLTILPVQAMNQLRATNATITNMSLITERNQTFYRISEKRKAKILGLFPVEVDVESSINAVNGTLISSNRPWWSFLAIE